MPHEKLKSQLKKLLLPSSAENIDKHIREATDQTKTYEDFLEKIEAKEKAAARFRPKTKAPEPDEMEALEISELDLQSRESIAK